MSPNENLQAVPQPVVGVLAPLRLETRFLPPAAGAGWVIKVRLVPDAPSLDRHQPLATAAELEAVETLWRDSGGDLTTALGQAQWRRFAAQVGPARGAWLARTFPPLPTPDGGVTIGRPPQLRENLASGRVRGLPDTLELWLARGGGAPARVATLPVDQDRLLLNLPDPGTGEARWWSSFAEAKAVGLGVEIDLGQARPDDLDVLYAVGLGADGTAELFGDHRDAGQLGVLDPGTPTNTVDGEPAADLAGDPETWRALLLGQVGQSGAEAVSLALTGDPGQLLPLPGGDRGAVAVNQAMVAALWSVLWGHALTDVWKLGDGGRELGLWAIGNLVPEGPVPPVRIGDQPFGILPVTSLARWRAAPGDPPVEEPLRVRLSVLRSDWTAVAESAGTTVGADTGRLLDLLARTPTSTGYAWRWFLPLELLHALWWGYGSGVAWEKLFDWWDRQAAAVRSLGQDPSRRYATLGWPQDLDLPLVQPDNLPFPFDQAVVRLLGYPLQSLASESGRRELWHPWPNSLLLRLLAHAAVVNAAEVTRVAHQDRGPLLDPVAADAKSPTRLQFWCGQFRPGLVGVDLASQLFLAWEKGAAGLIGSPVDVLERVLRATLDTASHRIDPWVTGIAWRRLRTLVDASPPAQFRLGAYGWVDAPRPRAATAPADEYLHAPSQEQALVLAVLRDRALFDAEPGRWQVDVDSDSVRLADQLAAEVRLGAHLTEALGRAVERAVATPADVERLRKKFPIRAEHGGRRVCDGRAVLARFAANPTNLGLTTAQLAALEPLAEAVDTYGDLLVADAVHDVVSGRAALAAGALEAAAGLDSPPSLDVLRTQRGGRTVSTAVVVALPDAAPPAPPGPATSPGRLADPAVAAFLDTELAAGWTWQVTDVGTQVSLADLGLEPVDTLSLSAADLAKAVRAHAGGEQLDPEGEHPAHTACRRLTDILGGRPAVPADLADDGSQPPDAAVQTDLLARYTLVRQVGEDLHTALVGAAVGSEADRQLGLRNALRWGITPLDADEPTSATLVDRAAGALRDRLDRSPATADAADLSVELLARALAELVSPEGRSPVLARVALDQVPAALQAAGADLDPGWLETVAPVRLALARLEAHQLERRLAADAAFAAWTNRPDDPWQADLGPTPPPAGLGPSTKLVAAFGPGGVLDPGADPGRTVAVGLLDSWGEVIPATEHATTVAFHFDAPAARAPQALLVAVPPALDTPLDTATLVDMLAETRLLARARMARPEELDRWSPGSPLTLFPVAGPTGVDLLRTP